MVGDWAPKWRELYPFWGSVDDIVKKGPVGREFVPKLDQIFHTGDAIKNFRCAHAHTVVLYVFVYWRGVAYRRNDFPYAESPRSV